MPPLDLGVAGKLSVTSEVAQEMNKHFTEEERQNLRDVLNAPGRVSDFKNLYYVVDQPLTARLNQGYVIYQNKYDESDPYNGKKVGMVRSEDVSKAFEEMGIEVKEAANTIEATAYLKQLFKDYEDDFPYVFDETNWFDTYNTAKFQLFYKRAKDKGLPYFGYQDSYGTHYHSGKTLYSWLPVLVVDEFTFLCSNSGAGAECCFGNMNNALPVPTSFAKAA